MVSFISRTGVRTEIPANDATLNRCCRGLREGFAWHRGQAKPKSSGGLALLEQDPLVGLGSFKVFVWACGALAPSEPCPAPSLEVLLGAAMLCIRLQCDSAEAKGRLCDMMRGLASGMSPTQLHGDAPLQLLHGWLRVLGAEGGWDLGLPENALRSLCNQVEAELAVSMQPAEATELVDALVAATLRVRRAAPQREGGDDRWPCRAASRLCVAAWQAAWEQPLLARLLRGVGDGGFGGDVPWLAAEAITSMPSQGWAMDAAEQLRGLLLPLVSLLDGPGEAGRILFEREWLHVLELMWVLPPTAAGDFAIHSCFDSGGGDSLTFALTHGSAQSVPWFLGALTRGGALDAAGAASALVHALENHIVLASTVRAVLGHLQDLAEEDGGCSRPESYEDLARALRAVIAGGDPTHLHAVSVLLDAGREDRNEFLAPHLLEACGAALEPGAPLDWARNVKQHAAAGLAKHLLEMRVLEPETIADDTWENLVAWAGKNQDSELQRLLKTLSAP